jgi:hypothetical protein
LLSESDSENKIFKLSFKVATITLAWRRSRLAPNIPTSSLFHKFKIRTALKGKGEKEADGAVGLALGPIA